MRYLTLLVALLVTSSFAFSQFSQQRAAQSSNRTPVPVGPKLQWASLYDGGILAADRWKSVAIDSLGNAYVVGDRQTTLGAESALAKVDPQGNVLWSAGYQGIGTGFIDHGVDVKVLPDDSVVALATAPGIPNGVASKNQNAILSRYDSSGTLLWRTVYDHEWNDQPTGIALAPNGTIYVALMSYNGPPNNDIVLLAFDSAGNLLWETHWNGPSTWDNPIHLVVNDQNEVYVGGVTLASGVPNNLDWVLLKFSPAGALVWSQQFGGLNLAPDYLMDLTLGPDGDVYATGSIGDVPGTTDAAVFRFESNGALVWRATNLSGAYYQGISIAVDDDGTVFIGTPSAAVLAFDDFGQPLWETSGLANGILDVSAIGVDRNGHLIASGTAGALPKNLNLSVLDKVSGAVVYSNTYGDARWQGVESTAGSRTLAFAPGNRVVLAGYSHQPTWLDVDGLILSYHVP